MVHTDSDVVVIVSPAMRFAVVTSNDDETAEMASHGSVENPVAARLCVIRAMPARTPDADSGPRQVTSTSKYAVSTTPVGVPNVKVSTDVSLVVPAVPSLTMTAQPAVVPAFVFVIARRQRNTLPTRSFPVGMARLELVTYAVVALLMVWLDVDAFRTDSPTYDKSCAAVAFFDVPASFTANSLASATELTAVSAEILVSAIRYAIRITAVSPAAGSVTRNVPFVLVIVPPKLNTATALFDRVTL